MFGKRFSRALAVTTVASLITATAAFAADLKADASTLNGTQTSVDVGSQAGGSDLTHAVKLFVQGGGPQNYPFTVVSSDATGAVTSATDVELTAGGEANGKHSTVSYSVPCTAGAFSGSITFTAPESSGLNDRVETITITGTATLPAQL